MREPSDPSAKQLLPADPGAAVRVGAEAAPLRSPRSMAVSSPSSRIAAWTRTGRSPVSARRAYAGNAEPGPGRARAPPGSWHGDDAERRRVLRRPLDERGSRSLGGRGRRRGRDQAGRGLVQDALGSPSAARRMIAAGGSGVAGVDARPRERRLARPDRVVVVRPEGDAAPGRRRFEVGGGRPAAPAVGVPALALEPRLRSASALVRRPDPRPGPSSSVGASARSTWRRASAASSEVEVGVGQPRGSRPRRARARSAAWTGPPASRARPRPGERDPASADRRSPRPSRTRPVAGERRDPAGDEHVERHPLSPLGPAEQGGQPGAVEARTQARGQRDPRLDRAERPGLDRSGADPRRAAARERVAGRRPRRPGSATRARPGCRAIARCAASSSAGDVFPPRSRRPRCPAAPGATAASISAPSMPMPRRDEVDRSPRRRAAT